MKTLFGYSRLNKFEFELELELEFMLFWHLHGSQIEFTIIANNQLDKQLSNGIDKQNVQNLNPICIDSKLINDWALNISQCFTSSFFFFHRFFAVYRLCVCVCVYMLRSTIYTTNMAQKQIKHNQIISTRLVFIDKLYHIQYFDNINYSLQ